MQTSQEKIQSTFSQQGQRYSSLLGKTLKEAPSEIEAKSHLLLTRAGFIDKPLAAGVYSLLPLGWRVDKKIANIIREEMQKLGAQEMVMPAMHPQKLWQETGRWETMEPPLFKFQDRFKRNYCLAPTHEEVISDIARRFVQSYRDLPFSIYQIQDKFRNEKRARGGLLRGREFWMKDLYSFHTDQQDLDKFYSQVRQAYFNIFQRCGLQAKAVAASSGSIGGAVSHEFMVLAEAGEDRIVFCQNCDWAANMEILEETRESPEIKCPQCNSSSLKEARAIENGHIFQLGTLYSEKMGVTFVDKNSKKKFVLMGCYGIGLERLLATVVEVHHDKEGIVWPKEIAPFQVHLVGLDLDDKKVFAEAERTFRVLAESGIDVLYDDRQDISAGIKFKDADLIGCPYRVVVSKKTLKAKRVELKLRKTEKVSLLTLQKLLAQLQ